MELLTSDLEEVIRKRRKAGGSEFEPSSNPFTPPSLSHRLNAAKMAAKGITWLHSEAVIHRDIKPANLMFDKDYNVKVVDFGLAHFLKNNAASLHDNDAIGTPVYMAPEVINAHETTKKSDSYAFGICLWEIVTCRLLRDSFKFSNFIELKKKVVEEHWRPPLPDNCPPLLAELLTSCWKPNPHDRLSFSEIVAKMDPVINEAKRFEYILQIKRLVKDPTAAQFYIDSFTELQVPWDEFQTKFLQYFNLSFADKKTKIQMRSLRFTICINKTTATAQRWGQAASWFMPFTPLASFLERLLDVYRCPCFKGLMASDVAENMLVTEPPGTFLFRFSASKLGCFCLSNVDANGKIIHTRILNTGAGKLKILNGKKKEYESLLDIMAHGAVGGLHLISPHSNSSLGFLLEESENEISGYIVEDDEEED